MQERRRLGGWPAVSTLLLVLLFLLGGCVARSGPPKAQTPLPDLLLRLDATKELGGDSQCKSRRVTTTEVVGAVEQGSQRVSSRWTERWTVDRCGVLVPYLVKFARTPDGDLDIAMELDASPSEIGTVPGATIADPILQRDVLAFLAQRDFPVAGPKSTCHTRKVIDTEMLQPLEGAAVEGDRPVQGQWVERWTLDRCEMPDPARYIVRFKTTPKGTTFTAEREP